MKGRGKTFLFLASTGMELSYLYACANFFTLAVFNHTFPFPEAVASLVIAPSSFLNREYREEILGGDKTSIRDALYSGLTSNIAQLLRYVALGFGSAIVVSLMLRTIPLWSLLFSFLFMREYESFSRWVLLGNALLVVGAILVLFS